MDDIKHIENERHTLDVKMASKNPNILLFLYRCPAQPLNMRF
jgi:hypothetical protein